MKAHGTILTKRGEDLKFTDIYKLGSRGIHQSYEKSQPIDIC